MMSQLILGVAAAAIILGLFWLGLEPGSPLARVLLRPAVMALLAMALIVLAVGEHVRWPYALVAAAATMGLWEAYAGAYQMLGEASVKRKPVQQVQICAAWLGNALLNLILLNMAAFLAYPQTYQWRGEQASILDVAYLTMLTFASGGYGDVLPATTLGKLLVMITSFSGLIYATILFAALFHALRED